VILHDPTGQFWDKIKKKLSAIGNFIVDNAFSIALVAIGTALCFVPGAQAFGISLIIAGGSGLLSSGLAAAGIDSKTASIISSVASIIGGVALCFSGVGMGIGVSMIASGIGGIAGGYIGESLGFGFEAGAMVGSIIGAIAGGRIYDGYKTAQIAKQKMVVIGETSKRVATKAEQIGAGTYEKMPGYNLISKISTRVANRLSLAHNATWIHRVHRSGVAVVDMGIDVNRTTRSVFYRMEIERLLMLRALW
jgi:MFS family permease